MSVGIRLKIAEDVIQNPDLRDEFEDCLMSNIRVAFLKTVEDVLKVLPEEGLEMTVEVCLNKTNN